MLTGAELEARVAASPGDDVLLAYAAALDARGEPRLASLYRCLAGGFVATNEPAEQQVALWSCAVASWLLRRDVTHRFPAFTLDDEHPVFHVLRGASDVLQACAARVVGKARRAPKLPDLEWPDDEAGRLPPRQRVEALWRALGALRTLGSTEDDVETARQVMRAAREASSWPEFRAWLEVAVLGSDAPFTADAAVLRAVKRKARPAELSANGWPASSTLEFRQVRLNNNAMGIEGRLFPVSSGDAVSSQLLVASLVADDELGGDFPSMSAKERAEWFNEETPMRDGPWRAMSWFEVLATLGAMLADNHGASATEEPGDVDGADGQRTSLPEALRPLGVFHGAAVGAWVTVLRFERAWWLLRPRL